MFYIEELERYSGNIDMNDYSYMQISKRIVRHKILFHAVDTLTRKRGEACCVSRNYVRKVYDYFTQTEDYSNNSEEAKKIERSYITNWEHLHDSCIGKKNVEDLTVCYLCGPEPNNDFQELVDLGILPQNIWAFESVNKTYKLALESYDEGQFPQPRLLKQNIETFFKFTPKKFDIVYIDACGSVPSDQHALRCLTAIFRYSRLSSPGVVITNFSAPDAVNENVENYIELISTYLYFKHYSHEKHYDINHIFENEQYSLLEKNIRNNFLKYYGDFISAAIRDIPSVFIPLQRLAENPYFCQLISDINANNHEYMNLIKQAHGNSISQFVIYCEYLRKNRKLPDKIDLFLKEIEEKEHTLIKGVVLLLQLKDEKNDKKEEMKLLRQCFSGNSSVYQFLDKPHSNLVIDAIINQLVYPMHFCPWRNWRYKYCAKIRDMFTDVSVYDECRYIYEWMPAVHQLASVLRNESWQYVFRFAMDGLIKSRQIFNNEFFYQGAVVSPSIDGFGNATLSERVDYNNM